MKKKRLGGAGILGILLLLLILPPESLSFSLEGRVKEFTLKNGMKVLMMERHQSPTLALYIRFRVGAVDENLGMTGTAHLLEHMLFKGTKTLGTKNYAEEEKILNRLEYVGMALDAERVKGAKSDPTFRKHLEETLQELEKEHKKWVIKDEIESIYSENGAVGFNAMTGADTTTYVVSLPANRLELWARIESDRILNPVFREFYSERKVVMEERRQSIESQPERKLVEQFLASSFIAHPYGRPVIGWSSDLAYLEKRTTEQFFRTFYSPGNTVLTLVGSLRPDSALPILQKYFERIPRQILPPPLRTQEPKQVGERRIQVLADAKPQLVIGFHKPHPPDPDDAVLEIIDGLLTTGRTSRFYKTLIEEEKIAVEVSSSQSFPGERYPNLFVIFATPRHPHTAEELEKGIYRELDRLRTDPLPAVELEKVKNEIQTGFLRKLNSNSRLAYWLSYGQSLFGSWRHMEQRLQALDQVTAEDIRRVARKYFTAQNRTVATLVPTSLAKEK